MIKIRYNSWQSNSSSAHSLAIKKDKEDFKTPTQNLSDFFPLNGDMDAIIADPEEIETSWGPFICDTPNEKFLYFLADCFPSDYGVADVEKTAFDRAYERDPLEASYNYQRKFKEDVLKALKLWDEGVKDIMLPISYDDWEGHYRIYNGDIDHQSRGLLSSYLGSRKDKKWAENLYNFIYNPSIVVLVDNDNHYDYEGLNNDGRFEIICMPW